MLKQVVLQRKVAQYFVCRQGGWGWGWGGGCYVCAFETLSIRMINHANIMSADVRAPCIDRHVWFWSFIISLFTFSLQDESKQPADFLGWDIAWNSRVNLFYFSTQWFNSIRLNRACNTGSCDVHPLLLHFIHKLMPCHINLSCKLW